MPTRLTKYSYLIAAALALAGVAFYFFSKPDKPQALHSDLFQPEKEKLDSILGEIKAFGFAGVPQNRQDSLAVALDFYGSANYPEANKSLKNYLVAYSGDLTARFYLGMTHLYLGAPAEAFGILSPLSELITFEMQDDARWYAALAATKVDQVRATGLFARLSKDPESKYREAAQAVMSSSLKNRGEMSFRIEGGEGGAGELLQCSLVIAARVAWWQAGWFRAIIAFLFPLGGAGMVIWRNKARRLEKEKGVLEKEKERSEELLLNILPAETAAELKMHGRSHARRFDVVTVLFSDFQGFTQISEDLPAEELVANLDSCFEAFDHITTTYRLEKIKTVGDCYVCAGGLPAPGGDDAARVIRAAIEMQAFLRDFNARQLALGKPAFSARIGIHTGPLVAGIVGIKKYAYDIWGDTVNIAARMEQASEGGRINLSGTTYDLVKTEFACQHRGKVKAKGKGVLDMYFVAS